MSKYINHGIYADLIKQYYAYGKNLGFKMFGIDSVFARFDQLTIIRHEDSIGITKELFEVWFNMSPQETSANRYYRVCNLAKFSSYLQQLGYNSYIPRLPKYESTFVPYIFTQAEITSIFQASDKLFVKVKAMDSSLCVMPTLLRLLYSTGIRLGEALNLKNEDVDLGKECLLLKSTKNGQDCIVPISKSMIEVFKDYIIFKKQQLIEGVSGSYFFTAGNGNKCNAKTIYAHFRTVLQKAEIGHGGRGVGPRLHDLRHTFCINSLVKLSDLGMDLYYSLPILSTYIGHQSIEATNRYVRLTAELYPQLLVKLDATGQYIFSENQKDPSIKK